MGEELKELLLRELDEVGQCVQAQKPVASEANRSDMA